MRAPSSPSSDRAGPGLIWPRLQCVDHGSLAGRCVQGVPSATTQKHALRHQHHSTTRPITDMYTAIRLTQTRDPWAVACRQLVLMADRPKVAMDNEIAERLAG